MTHFKIKLIQLWKFCFDYSFCVMINISLYLDSNNRNATQEYKFPDLTLQWLFWLLFDVHDDKMKCYIPLDP